MVSKRVQHAKKRCHPFGWHLFLEYGPRNEPVVRPSGNSVRSTASAHSADGFVCLTEQLPGRHSASFAGGVFPHILNCLLIHSVHTTQREEPSIRMALLFGILTPASAQFEPDKHAPNQSGWLGACIFSAKNAYFFFALIAACAAARRAMGTRNGLHET